MRGRGCGALLPAVRPWSGLQFDKWLLANKWLRVVVVFFSQGCSTLCMCALTWRLPLLNKPARKNVFFMCPCSMADHPCGIFHQWLPCPVLLRQRKGSTNVCWVLGQVLRTDICGSRYCISIKYDFFIILNCILYCVFFLNISQPF